MEVYRGETEGKQIIETTEDESKRVIVGEVYEIIENVLFIEDRTLMPWKK
jgi:hypothetical protein